jgi:NADH dehydrogenase (ubiquinone) Fe-S protein 1
LINHIYINGTCVAIEGMNMESYSVIQHCELAQVEIPRFCYHDTLSIAGNCRMCVVELEDSAKLVISCATEILPYMSISTNSVLVKQAREYVLEFLLFNHPLDCPICDQGGECDLQDISLTYGSDQSRYALSGDLTYNIETLIPIKKDYPYFRWLYKERIVMETHVLSDSELYGSKRGVSDKYFGPLIKTVMTRCIHCTRCVRFFDEIVGNSILGTIGRGSSTEIGTYIYDVFISATTANGQYNSYRPSNLSYL